MKRPKGKIGWITSADDEVWQASPAPTSTEPPSFLRHRDVALAALLIAALLLLAGGWLWPRTAPAQRSTLQSLASVARPAETLTRTLELQEENIQVVKLQRFDDHLLAQVIVSYPEEGKMRAYRESRLFVKQADQWQHTRPNPALMGPRQSLTIANFTILYPSVDADAVYEAVPKLEQLYATLRHDFGLPLANATYTATSTYTIEVAADRVRNSNDYSVSVHRMAISSPTLLSAPVEMPPATLLYQAMIYPLASMVLRERMDQHNSLWRSIFARWSPIERALPLWEVWQDGGPLAGGRGEVISWLYQNSKSETAHQQLPLNYRQICRTYGIWQLIPLDLFIPLTCTEDEQKQRSPDTYALLAPTWLQQTNYTGKRSTLSPSPYAATLTAETILEYIVATYGRDKLPQLIEGMGEYPTPETLIPALFGVSRSDFEAGWQVYLAEHY